MKALGKLIRVGGMEWADPISKWRSAENLRQARASLVSFVWVAGEATYYPLIEESVRVVLGREERFAKTAVGWILRDISKHDPSLAQRATEGNVRNISMKSLRNATKSLDPMLRARYLGMLKSGQAAG